MILLHTGDLDPLPGLPILKDADRPPEGAKQCLRRVLVEGKACSRTCLRVDVRMRNPDATGRRHFVGTLRGVDGSLATLEVDGLRVELDVGAMERARLVPDV